MNKTYVTNYTNGLVNISDIAKRYDLDIEQTWGVVWESQTVKFEGGSGSIERMLRDLYYSNPMKCSTLIVPTYKKVIFNEPATIILWNDGSKTVVKCTDGEEYDPATGFAMAYVKKLYGNTGGIFRRCQKDYNEQMAKREKYDK